MSMLKIDEVLKKLEEIDRVLKSVDETKTQILLSIENIVKKHSENLSKNIEEIINKTIEEYKLKVINEAKNEAEKLRLATKDAVGKIKALYEERKGAILQKSLELLSL